MRAGDGSAKDLGNKDGKKWMDQRQGCGVNRCSGRGNGGI